MNNDNVIEKIKEKLKVEHPDVYEEWKNNQFDVKHLFCAVYDNDLRTERVDKYTLMHLDTRNNLKNLVGSLLEAEGININVLKLSLWTLLHHAAIYKSKEVIDTLLKSGKINVNAQSCMGYTALHISDCYQS